MNGAQPSGRAHLIWSVWLLPGLFFPRADGKRSAKAQGAGNAYKLTGEKECRTTNIIIQPGIKRGLKRSFEELDISARNASAMGV